MTRTPGERSMTCTTADSGAETMNAASISPRCKASAALSPATGIRFLLPGEISLASSNCRLAREYRCPLRQPQCACSPDDAGGRYDDHCDRTPTAARMTHCPENARRCPLVFTDSCTPPWTKAMSTSPDVDTLQIFLRPRRGFNLQRDAARLQQLGVALGAHA